MLYSRDVTQAARNASCINANLVSWAIDSRGERNATNETEFLQYVMEVDHVWLTRESYWPWGTALNYVSWASA